MKNCGILTHVKLNELEDLVDEKCNNSKGLIYSSTKIHGPLRVIDPIHTCPAWIWIEMFKRLCIFEELMQ